LRECIVLREFEELSYKEIAQVTDNPIGTIMSRLWRARQLLLEIFLAEVIDAYVAPDLHRNGITFYRPISMRAGRCGERRDDKNLMQCARCALCKKIYAAAPGITPGVADEKTSADFAAALREN